MSIYSGFATRFQQETYDHCIDSLLYILQKRILKFYQNESADEQKFISLVLKLQHQMRNMEKNKYLEPKSSQSLSELAKFLSVHQQTIISNQIVPIQPEPLPIIKPILKPEEPAEIKKPTFWVEKSPPKQQKTHQQKQTKEVQVQTQELAGTKQASTGRTTIYNRGENKYDSKMKATSRSNLGKQRFQINREEIKPLKSNKNRSMSNYNIDNNQMPFQSRVTYQINNNITADPSGTIQRRKERSSLKAHNGSQTISNDHQNEVSQIIKDYIIKSKKQYTRGFRQRQYGQSKAKIDQI